MRFGSQSCIKHQKISRNYSGYCNVLKLHMGWSEWRHAGLHSITRSNLWLSFCLVRGLKDVRWDFLGENRLGAGPVQNPAFPSCLFTMIGKRPTENPSNRSVKFAVFSYKNDNTQHFRWKYVNFDYICQYSSQYITIIWTFSRQRRFF